MFMPNTLRVSTITFSCEKKVQIKSAYANNYNRLKRSVYKN